MNIPIQLECAYCIRAFEHGGECHAPKRDSSIGCLIFKPDPRGCIRRDTAKLPIGLFQEAPTINHWDDRWTMYDVDTEIRITKIYGISWDKQGGYLYIHADYDYYINEFHEDFNQPIESPELKLIK